MTERRRLPNRRASCNAGTGAQSEVRWSRSPERGEPKGLQFTSRPFAIPGGAA